MMEQHLEVQQVPHRQQRKLPYPYHLVAHQQQEAGLQVMRSSLLEIHTYGAEQALPMVQTAPVLYRVYMPTLA